MPTIRPCWLMVVFFVGDCTGQCRFASNPAAPSPLQAAGGQPSWIGRISLKTLSKFTLFVRYLFAITLTFIGYYGNILLVNQKGIDMATATAPPRPDLAAHKEALTLPFSKLVSQLADSIGRKLTAYVANVKDVRAVDRWIAGGEAYGDVEQRLRFTFQVVRTLRDYDSPRVVQAWLTGVNPELGDRVPVRLLREGDLNTVAAEVMGAARAFVAGG